MCVIVKNSASNQFVCQLPDEKILASKFKEKIHKRYRFSQDLKIENIQRDAPSKIIKNNNPMHSQSDGCT